MTAIWKDVEGAEPEYPTLQGSVTVDDVIIGGGITGLTTALKLIDAGRRVAVVEALTIAESSTGNSTGNLYSTLSNGLTEIDKKWSSEVVCELVKIRERGLTYLAEIVARFSIDCDFQRVPLHWCAAVDDQEMIDRVEAEYEISAQAGLQTQLYQQLPELPMPIGKALQIDNQAQFNPFRFTQALAQAVSQLGGHIFEHSRVTEIHPQEHVIKTQSGEVHASNIIQATHTPKGLNVLQAEMEVFREYGCASPFEGSHSPKGIYWMLSDSQSIRSHVKHEQVYVIAVGGKHKTGQGEPETKYFDQVQSYINSHFGTSKAAYKWSAQQYRAADLLPYIGRSGHDHVFVATGFAADGLVWGPVAADIIAAQILGLEHAGSDLFDPRRFTPAKSAKNWAKESGTIAKELFKSYLTPGARAELDDIAPGDAKLVKVDGKELAVYHSPEEGMLALSSICPHMKCRVAWNAEAISWDCPCHGSRFTVQGDIIEGPACEPLQVYDVSTR